MGKKDLIYELIYDYGVVRRAVKRRTMYWGKNASTEHSRGNKTVPEKVATTRTEDVHKQNTKTSATI